MSNDLAPADAPRPGLSRNLRWALGLSVAASAWALLWPGGEAPADNASPAVDPAVPATPTVLPRPTTRPLIAASAEREAWQAATADPFHAAPPEPPAPPPTARAEPPPEPKAPPPPPPPPVYAVIGQMKSPEGEHLVLLGRTDKPGGSIVAKEGLQLEDGFMVLAVSSSEVRMRRAESKDEVHLPIPQAASQGSAE